VQGTRLPRLRHRHNVVQHIVQVLQSDLAVRRSGAVGDRKPNILELLGLTNEKPPVGESTV
jgi:hypothetical protein